MPDTIIIRAAHAGDEPIIAHHRASMFRDIGSLPSSLHEAMRAESVAWTRSAMVAGSYRGWLACPAESPEVIIGGAGVLLRDIPPTVPRPSIDPRVLTGRQALVINVFTEREWRGRGVARRLMEVVIRESRELGVVNIVLHAAPDGRHLYETLGFVATNEMRLTF